MARMDALREAASGDTREGILRAALRAFAQKGFDGASTRDIAASAGVNHGLLRHYFGPKQKLWQAAVDLAFADMQASLDALLADPSIPDDRARAARVIRSHVHYVAEHPEFVRLMFEEGKRRGPRMRWMVDRHVQPLYDAVRSLLDRGSTRGGLPFEIPPVHFFYLLAGAAGALFHQAEECRRVSGVDPFEPEVVEEHARVLERLLLGPPDPESGG
jgi:TetR/AcrR family transcriptional regulator